MVLRSDKWIIPRVRALVKRWRTWRRSRPGHDEPRESWRDRARSAATGRIRAAQHVSRPGPTARARGRQDRIERHIFSRPPLSDPRLTAFSEVQ